MKVHPQRPEAGLRHALFIALFLLVALLCASGTGCGCDALNPDVPDYNPPTADDDDDDDDFDDDDADDDDDDDDDDDSEPGVQVERIAGGAPGYGGVWGASAPDGHAAVRRGLRPRGHPLHGRRRRGRAGDRHILRPVPGAFLRRGGQPLRRVPGYRDRPTCLRFAGRRPVDRRARGPAGPARPPPGLRQDRGAGGRLPRGLDPRVRAVLRPVPELCDQRVRRMGRRIGRRRALRRRLPGPGDRRGRSRPPELPRPDAEHLAHRDQRVRRVGPNGGRAGRAVHVDCPGRGRGGARRPRAHRARGPGLRDRLRRRVADRGRRGRGRGRVPDGADRRRRRGRARRVPLVRVGDVRLGRHRRLRGRNGRRKRR